MDFTALASTISTQVGTTLTAVAPIAGTILAAVVGWRLFKRFVK